MGALNWARMMPRASRHASDCCSFSCLIDECLIAYTILRIRFLFSFKFKGILNDVLFDFDPKMNSVWLMLK